MENKKLLKKKKKSKITFGQYQTIKKALKPLAELT